SRLKSPAPSESCGPLPGPMVLQLLVAKLPLPSPNSATELLLLGTARSRLPSPSKSPTTSGPITETPVPNDVAVPNAAGTVRSSSRSTRRGWRRNGVWLGRRDFCHRRTQVLSENMGQLLARPDRAVNGVARPGTHGRATRTAP